MKTLIFILLKTGELFLISLTALIVLVIGQFTAHSLGGCENLYSFNSFILGAATLVLTFATIVILWGLCIFIPYWISKNKEWSETIYNKIKRK